jgi:hypothetical protein
VPFCMQGFSALGGCGSRCSKGLPIEGRGIGWLDLLLRRNRHVRMLRSVLLFAGILFAYPATSSTDTLEWDASASDQSIAGYRLYYGVAPRTYPFVIDVGPATSCSVPPNLVFGTTYFFAVKAYSHLGIESDFCAEIVYTPHLRIDSIFTDDYGTVLSWASEPGALYRVLATETLTDPVWVDVSGPLFALSTTRLWPHIKAPGGRCIFYRIEAL